MLLSGTPAPALTCFVVALSASCLSSAQPAVASAPAPYNVPGYELFNYTHLYADAQGGTHIAECTVDSVPLSGFSGQSEPQAGSYSATLSEGNKTSFNQTPVGEMQGPNQPPGVPQFVAVLSGSW